MENNSRDTNASDERFDRVEQAIARLEASIDKRFDAVDSRFDRVERDLLQTRQELREEIRQGNEDTRSQLKVLIESVHDDVRLVAEGHVALERRVTVLEQRSR